jgi:hypothetical protein
MQNRIDRLESLVLSLMTNGAESAGPSAATAAISRSSGSQQNISEVDIDDGDMYGNDDESDTEQVTKSFGIMKVDSQNQKSYYISEAHWISILNDVIRSPILVSNESKADIAQIAEVRQYFATHKEQFEAQMEKVQEAHKDQDFSGPALVFGAMKPPNEAEIMSSFPSKYTTDILIARFFNTYDPAIRACFGVGPLIGSVC